MDPYLRVTRFILLSIVMTGLIAIPFGNPRFIDRAIILELTFIILFILVWKEYRIALYACIPLAMIVMIGNSLAPPHVNLMMTFSKPINAIVLIVGGYLLQGALLYTSFKSIRNLRAKSLTTA